MKVAYERWEADEFRICIGGKGPVGQTVNENDAKLICRWLPTALDEIINKHSQED